MSGLLPCPRCKQDVALSGFGRCSICGDILSDASPQHRRSIFGFTNMFAAIGMVIGVGGTAFCVLTLSLMGLFFTLPLVGAALRYRHESL